MLGATEVYMKIGPIPAPFGLMNDPVPTCSDPGCRRPVHIDPPPGDDQFCAHTFVPAIIGLPGMDRLPDGVDWFVVGARDTDGHRQIITIGDDESLDARKRMMEHAIADLDNAFRLPPLWASALMPASITHLFTTAIKVGEDGTAQCTTVASDECDDVDEPWIGEYRFRAGSVESGADG